MFHVTRQRNKFRSNRNIFASRIRGLRRPPRKKRFPPSPKIPPPPSRHLRSFESPSTPARASFICMKRVIHARRGGRPPGVEDKGRKSRGGENRDVLHHLPTLPTSFHGYLRSSAGMIPDTEGREGSIRSRRNGPPLATRAARQNLRSKGPRCADLSPSRRTTLVPRPRFRKDGMYLLFSSEFRGRSP